MKKLCIGAVMVLGLAAAAGSAEPPCLTLTLTEAERQAAAHSDRLQAKRFEREALQSREGIQGALLWPRLTLEASYRYLTEIPSLRILPNSPLINFGDHANYSVGPQIAWNLWDSGGTYYAWRAVQAQARAKEDELEAVRREVLLRTRLSYFQVQMALAQHQLISEQLKLAQAQYQDIQKQARAGQASRIDLLASHQEVLASQRQLRVARTDLAAALRDLLAQVGGPSDLDPSSPAAADAEGGTPSVRLALDSLESSLVRLEPAGRAPADPRYPAVRIHRELAEAGRSSAAGFSAAHWPKVQVAAKTSLDYPNGPVLETIRQNTLAVSASWSLFEFNRIVNQSDEQERGALANDRLAAQAESDLALNRSKAQDLLAQARDLAAFDRQAVDETAELARLVYQAYRTGRSGYLEVQSANTRAFAARFQAIRTQVQTLIQLAVLDGLSAREDGEPTAEIRN